MMVDKRVVIKIESIHSSELLSDGNQRNEWFKTLFRLGHQHVVFGQVDAAEHAYQITAFIHSPIKDDSLMLTHATFI